MRINLVQAELRWRDAEANREHLADLMAAAEPADLYVLPETFSTGFLGDQGQPAENMQGKTVAWMGQQARSLGGAVAGSLVMADDGNRFNRFLCADEAQLRGQYDKRHLFSYSREDQRYTAGSERVVFELNGWRINPQICYDLRFPVWCRARNNDFDLQIFVANWPSPRVQAWESLLQARAIENQCHVIGVNRVGEDGNGVPYPGRSLVFDPLGNCLADAGSEEGVVGAEISLEDVRQVRADFPFVREADSFQLID